MATQRTWVLFRHDTGYGDQLINHINQAISGKDMVAESSAPYDEMLSLADSKRAMAELEKAPKIIEDLLSSLDTKQARIDELAGFLTTTVELIRQANEIMGGDQMGIDGLCDEVQQHLNE